VTGSHTYAKPGAHKITVTVISASGATTTIKSTVVAGTYVALGDSYSSGEGSPPYDPGSDTIQDHCHRSPDSWTADVAATFSYTAFPNSFLTVACSGSPTNQIDPALPNGNAHTANYGEGSQLLRALRGTSGRSVGRARDHDRRR
jgi:hypothetical protein